MLRSEKLGFISFVQIIGMLLIILSHSISKYAVYPQFIGGFVQAIQLAGLTAFMWCSGYLLVYNDSLKRYGYHKYMSKRVLRLMLPYVVIQLIMVGPKILVEKFMGMAPISVDIIHCFLYPREGILPHLWFLPALTIICALAPILSWGIKTKTKSIITLLVLMTLLFVPSIPNILAVDDVRKYLFWFVLGMIVAKYVRIEKLQIKMVSLLCIPIYIGSFLLIEFSKMKWLICDLCTLWGLVEIGMLCNNRFSKIISLSKYTFPIYILSLPIQNIVEIVAGRFCAGGLVSTIAMFLAGLIVPLLIAMVVEKFERRFDKKICSICIGL